MKTVIIGAGQTGRGFVGRLLAPVSELVFVDRDERLLDEIKDGYKVSFFGGIRKNVDVTDIRTLSIVSPDVKTEIGNSDLLVISIKAENLPSLIPFLQSVSLPPVIVAENGIEPSRILRDKLPVGTCIADALIFCTTVNDGKDIISQDLDYLPYNSSSIRLPEYVPFTPEENLGLLAERKIYTYNTLSAVICYFGAEKGYERFEDAGNDEEISRILIETKKLLDRVISKRYGISYVEQSNFSQMAVDKFTNPEIHDSVERNARSVMRKLGHNERIVTPLLLAYEQGEDISLLEDLLVSALRYGVERENVKLGNPSVFLSSVCGIEDSSLRNELSVKIRTALK